MLVIIVCDFVSRDVWFHKVAFVGIHADSEEGPYVFLVTLVPLPHRSFLRATVRIIWHQIHHKIFQSNLIGQFFRLITNCKTERHRTDVDDSYDTKREIIFEE